MMAAITRSSTSPTPTRPFFPGTPHSTTPSMSPSQRCMYTRAASEPKLCPNSKSRFPGCRARNHPDT